MKTMETDTQYEEGPIERVETGPDGWTVTRDGACLFVTSENEKTPPAVGETARFYGKGFGYTVRGIVIGGRVYRYQTDAEESAAHAEWCANQKREKREAFAAGKAEFDARVAALPTMLRVRMEKFLATSPEWGAECGGYELFCCEEAAKIATALRTEDAVRAYHAARGAALKAMVPTVNYDDHSGNTFRTAVRLAHAMVTDETIVPKVHAGICAVIGCGDAGCFAGQKGAP